MEEHLGKQRNCGMPIKNGVANLRKYLLRLQTNAEVQADEALQAGKCLQASQKQERLETKKKRARSSPDSSPGKGRTNKKKPAKDPTETSTEAPPKTFANVVKATHDKAEITTDESHALTEEAICFL